jgi:mono/diheme cytochrome c family protein
MAKWTHGGLLRRTMALLLACLLVASAALLAAGCGNSGDADSGSATSTVASAARRVVPVRRAAEDRWTYARARFNEICAGCHTLANAGATGRRFNLDRGGGIDETHVRSTIANGEPGMPRFKDVLSEREYEELVAYLVAVGGRGRGGGEDYWSRQIHLRIEGENWSPDDTERIEEYARRLARKRLAEKIAAEG